MENSGDPHHVEWLHGYYATFVNNLAGRPGPRTFSKRHIKVAFDQFEFGIIKRRVLEGGSEESDDWKIGHPLVFPKMLRVGGAGMFSFQIRVPMDDEHTWHVWYQCYMPDEHGSVPPQPEIPTYEVPVYDAAGNIIIDYVDGQDIMAWMTQGTFADRSEEHLGTSDAGVIMLRRLLFENMEIVKGGGDPMGTVRDPQRCWGSLFTARALGCRLKNKLDYRACPMAVGVIELVQARASGVAFSIHPVTGKRDRVVIEGSWGWGEAVVAGLVTPDHLEICRAERRILVHTVSDKKQVSRFDYARGAVVDAPMPARFRTAAALTDGEALAIADAVLAIEALFDAPVDVEWVVDRHHDESDAVAIVQARPETIHRNAAPVAKPTWDPVAFATKYAFGARSAQA